MFTAALNYVCEGINNVSRCSVLALKIIRCIIRLLNSLLALFAGICHTDVRLPIYCSLLLLIPDLMDIAVILRLHGCSTRSEITAPSTVHRMLMKTEYLTTKGVWFGAIPPTVSRLHAHDKFSCL